MAAWRNLGYLMVIFLAGLQTVPRELLEAAQVDGAGPWQQFRYVTLPMLRPVLLFGAVIADRLPAVLRRAVRHDRVVRSIPPDRSLTTSTTSSASATTGFAAAASYVLFVAIVALTAVQFRILRPRD